MSSYPKRYRPLQYYSIARGLPCFCSADYKGPFLCCLAFDFERSIRVFLRVLKLLARSRKRAPPSYELTLPLLAISSHLLSKPINQHCSLGSPPHLVLFYFIEASRTSSPNRDFAYASTYWANLVRPSTILSRRTHHLRATTVLTSIAIITKLELFCR